MKPSERIFEARFRGELAGRDEIGIILDEMREQLDELLVWKESVKDQLI